RRLSGRSSRRPLWEANRFPTTPPRRASMRRIKTRETPEFTVDDHLTVQKQIEKRAHEIWCARGCKENAAFYDWLFAEREVLENFILTYSQPESSLQASPLTKIRS